MEKRWGGGSLRVNKKFLIVNIIKFNKKVDNPRGLDQVEPFFLVKSRHFLMLFLGLFITNLVVFHLYLAIQMRKNPKKSKEKKKNILLTDPL